MIRVVDYGVGNIQAFLNLFKRLGFDAQRAATPEGLLEATRLILPGVGHFDHAMQRLNDSGMRPLLDKGSEEGSLPGLNWLPGQVRAFANHPRSADLPMPHMGWNNLEICESAPLFDEGFDGAPQFYFLHSYYFEAEDRSDVAATAHYGFDFDAVVSRGHIHGVQCHPEKSHHWGEQLLKNFVEV